MSSSEENNKKLLNIVENLTERVSRAQEENDYFRNSVKEKINSFIPPVNTATNYLSRLLKYTRSLQKELDDLQNQIIDDIDGKNKQIIQNASNKLNEFSKNIQNTSELENSLSQLSTAVNDLQTLTTPSKRGGRKIRKFRKTKKKSKRKRIHKIKYH